MASSHASPPGGSKYRYSIDTTCCVITDMYGVTRQTEIRKLQDSLRTELAKILDVSEEWRKFARLIPQSQENSLPLYRSEHIQVFSEGKRSPTLKILDDWGTRGRERPTMQNLLDVLVHAELFRAADYIAVEGLHEPPLPRPSHGPSARLLPTDSQMDSVYIQKIADSLRVKCENRFKGATDKESHITAKSLGTLDDSGLEVRSSPPIWSGMSAVSDPDSEIGLPVQCAHYLYSDMQDATDGFNHKRILGRGGFGTVFWGSIPNIRQKVAIKRIDGINGRQFKTEVEVLSVYRHENLLPLLGYSCDNPVFRCLVYAYMANGSLQDRLALMNGTPPLDWKTRISVAVGTARGLVFLHTQGEKSLVHRDVKSANVLLDENFAAKVGDFGVVRAGVDPEMTTVIVTQAVGGTPVYMSDEALRGNITIKMDTFSFGIVLYELLTGLPPYDERRDDADLLSHMEESCEDISEFLDANAGTCPPNLSESLYGLAVRCTRRKKKHRPTIQEILPELESLQDDVEKQP